jgi:archaellum component FlaF (FlaF/FlaG flagellin family)
MTRRFLARATVWPRFIALFLLLPAVLVACSQTPPPVIDSPASDLDFKVTITDTNPASAHALVGVQVFQNGSLVQLGSNASIFAEGTMLQLSPGIYAYTAQVPRPAGNSYSISYFHASGIRTTEIPTRDRPVIVSPAPQSVVPRSASYPISYAPATATATGVRGSVSDSSQAYGGSPDQQADSGTYTGIDTRPLNAGPGTVSITREYDGQPANLAGFKSVTYTYYISSAEVDVIWQ